MAVVYLDSLECAYGSGGSIGVVFVPFGVGIILHLLLGDLACEFSVGVKCLKRESMDGYTGN